MDDEKMMSGLRCCIDDNCTDCPYDKDPGSDGCINLMQLDTLTSLLRAKLALYKMIHQFMHEYTDDDGTEYYDTYCESAGEAAFSVLGFEGDRIAKTEFYKLFDLLEHELSLLRTGKPGDCIRLELYEEEHARRLEGLLKKKRQAELCSGCEFDDCARCGRDEKVFCICPCDTCAEVDGKMNNYRCAAVKGE